MTYLKRNEAIRRLPIPRKGTKYVARAMSYCNSGVPVVVAIRDMLEFAKSSKEVKKIVNDRLIKINGKVVKDIKEAIKLFSILEADKIYKLTILPTGRFSFEETKDTERICKVINKKILSRKDTQLNLHDGTNIISNEKVIVGDSLMLDFNGKIKSKISFEIGEKVFVFSGKSVGLIGKIKEINKRKINVYFKDMEKEVALDKSHLIVLK